jgi:hypothetical protein
MTTKLAVEILKIALADANFESHMSYAIALNMAIEALQTNEMLREVEKMGENMKKLKDWTLGEVQAYCENTSCKDCVFYTSRGPGISCDLTNDAPKDWDLTDPPWFTEQEVVDAKTLLRLFERH